MSKQVSKSISCPILSSKPPETVVAISSMVIGTQYKTFPLAVANPN